MPANFDPTANPTIPRFATKTGKTLPIEPRHGARRRPGSPPARSSPIPWLIPVLLICLLLPAWEAEARVQIGDITVEQIPLFSNSDQIPYVGAIEYRFLIRNASTTRRHTVDLSVPQRVVDRRQSESTLNQMRRTVEVGPGSSVEVSLFQPSMSIRAGDIQARVQGVGSQIWYGDFQRVEQSWYRGGLASVSATPGVHLFSLISTDAGRYLGDEVIHPEFTRRPLREPAQWPTNWLSYSGFRVIAVTTAEWHRTSAAAREALMHWVRTGGTLLLVDRSFPQLPATARLLHTADRTRQFEYGHGRWIEVTTEAGSPEPVAIRAQAERLRNLLGSSPTRAADPAVFGIDGPHAELDRKQALPLRGLVLAVIVFALLLGPANLIVLRRKKGLMWIFVTVPAISLLSSLAIGAYSIFAEGISPRIRVSAIVTLDQRDQTAVTRGLFSYRTPLTPGGGLRFDDQVMIHPIRALPQDVTIDWTGGQHLNSGWVTAGNVTHLAFTRSDSQYRQGVLIQAKPDGSFHATNQLGVRIDELVYCDPEGRSWIADQVRAGAGVTLRRVPGQSDLQTTETARAYLARVAAVSDRDAESRPLHVPETWRAIITDPTFLDHGLGSGKVESRVLIFGITEELAP